MRNSQIVLAAVPGAHRLQLRILAVGFLFTAMVVGAGCATAPEEPGSFVDKNVDFSDFRTFGWYVDPARDLDTQPLSIGEVAIREAIVEEMQSKGYVESTTDSPADLLFSYQAARTEKVKSSPFRFGIGLGSYGSSGGASIGTSTSGVKNVTEGSLTIHAIDAERNAEVWRSDVTREMGKGNASSEDIKSIVADVFADFPARTSTPAPE